MTNYNDGKWHGWNGGECPVHLKSNVRVLWHSDDGEDVRCGMAGYLAWLGNERGNIVAFRVIKEHKEPRDLWLVLEAHGHIVTGCDNMDDAAKSANQWPGRTVMHVREVIE